MSWNGRTVVAMDAHIRERADKFFKDYIDPQSNTASLSTASARRSPGVV